MLQGLVYVNKHDQPSFWPCMEGLMNTTYGAMTAETFYQQVTAQAQTGDQHIAVFDQFNDAVHVAVAQVCQIRCVGQLYACCYCESLFL